MTAGLAEATANSFLNALCRNTSYAVAAFWLKLHLGDPGAAGAGNPAVETTRKQVTFGSVASGGSISSTADTTWTSVSTTETYSHVSFWTASTAGTFLGSSALSASKSVNSGDNFTIASGNGTLSFTPVAA